MIATEFYTGQGLGNQLWVYAVCRSLAEKLGCPFSIMSPERFHGKKFITLDFGEKLEGTGEVPNPHLPKGIKNYIAEGYILRDGIDVSTTDPEIQNVRPFTKIDGVMQSPAYLSPNVHKWIKVQAPYKTDACVVHVRLGDFQNIEVLLPKSYFFDAMEEMKAKKYELVSDEPDFASKILGIPSISSPEPDFHKAPHHMGGDISVDFSYLYNAKQLIIPNSSFSWWAAYLNPNNPKIIAPKYWAGWRRGYWSTGSIQTDKFTYIKP